MFDDMDMDQQSTFENTYQPDFEQVEQSANDPSQDFGPVSPKYRGKANIVVLGIGGGGCNAVNNMVKKNVTSATFVVMNTDLQALNMSPVPDRCKIQIGENTTQGLGAGSDPEAGKQAAEESSERIKAALQGVDLLFITAGMGGGTGTGAAPVVAKIAQDMGILTVGVVTKPFVFEGVPRMRNADEGIKKLKQYVDTLLVIPNQKLTTIFGDNKKMPITQAFAYADDVLRQGIQGVSDVIVNPGLINLDFADVKTILSKKGLAHMGIGFGKGEKRVMDAVRGAIYCPLLENDIEGATALLINIIGGEDMTIAEVEEACMIVNQVTDPNANIIFGTATRSESQGIEITIIATGFSEQRTTSKAFANTPYGQQDGQGVRPLNPLQPQSQDPFARGGYGGMYPGYPNQSQAKPTAQQPQAPTPSSSIVDVPRRKVPMFMRRIKDSENDNQ